MESAPIHNQLPAPEDATNRLYKNWREHFAIPLLIGVLVFGAFALIPAVSASDNLFIDAIFITTYLITGVVTIIRFPYLVRIGVFLASIYVLGLGELLLYGILGDSLFFFLSLIVFATILISPRAGITAMACTIGLFLLVGWLMTGGYLAILNPNAVPAKVEDWASAGAAMIMFGSVIILGFQRLELAFREAQDQIDNTLNVLTNERTNLENIVQERTNQLKKINEVERAVSSILRREEILRQGGEIIKTEFDCYFTAFYMLDITGQWAELKEASGEAGKVLKENKRRLDLSGKSSIAEVIRNKQGQIISDSDQIRAETPLLAYSRSQIVLPLIVGQTVLGALDIHSTKEKTFSQQDLDAYQNMANGIAIAVENANLFQEARQSLLELQATQRQYIQGAWQSLTAEKDLDYSMGDDNDPTITNRIALPLALREQVIGQIQSANSTEWTSEQKNLIEAIVAQATLALENARLVEESRSTATQERLANEITAKIWASANMDNILQTAVRELGRTLEASEVEIELSMDDKKYE
jgi:GAF domain-containing protein